MVHEDRNYGRSLPDQVDRIATLFDTHVNLISDVRELYRERAALEREYATKLQALTRKAVERKSKLEVALVLGDDPTKAWDSSTLRKNTLNVAYGGLIDSLIGTAQDHVDLADAVTSQIVEVLRLLELRSNEAKKKEIQFFQKLVGDRDRVYADRTKHKAKYDEECSEIEVHRQKQGRAQDDKHVERAAKQAEQQRNDMLTSKNVYLISTAVANRTKAKFYSQDLPELENQFQDLQTRLVGRFVRIIVHSQNLQAKHLNQLKSRIEQVQNIFQQVNPAQDQDLFIDYNIRAFTAPSDWKFEPCSTHYDTGDMSIEPTPKIFLQNKLAKCKSKMQELGPLMKTKRGEAEHFEKQIQTYNLDHTVGNIDDINDKYLDALHQLTLFTSSECVLQAEIDTIVAAVGGDVGGQYPHAFKSTSFSIPATCGYCKSSIWGLSKQGKTCKTCGLAVHLKCELKVPADCQHPGGAGGGRHNTSAFPKNEQLSQPEAGRSQQTPTPSSFTRSVATDDSLEPEYPSSRVLFDYTATSEFELSIADGDTVRVIEPDDGSGWVKVMNSIGKHGLVPASYLGSENTPSSGDTEGQHVRAIYPYQSQGADELSLKEGELIQLTSGPHGGQNYGDGWWEGINSSGRRGIFPSNYVEMA